MREIKFRAKAKFNGTLGSAKWIYSSILRYAEPFLNLGGFECDIETFGQFTGLHDATKWEELTEEERAEWTRAGNLPSEWKGKEIYEGDKCNVSTSDGRITHAFVRFVDGCSELEFVSPVVIDGEYRTRDYLKCSVINHAVKIIGNIHDK